MKLYLAKVTEQDLMHGSFEFVRGVFSSPETAVKAFNGVWDFEEKAEKRSETLWRRVWYGHLTVFYEIVEVKLDEVLDV